MLPSVITLSRILLCGSTTFIVIQLSRTWIRFLRYKRAIDSNLEMGRDSPPNVTLGLGGGDDVAGQDAFGQVFI